MPISLLEAISYGSIPIVSDIPELLLLIDDEETGLIFRKGDHVHLSEKINFLINNREMITKLSKSCREMSKQYDWSIIAEKTKRIYAELLSEKVK
jgi:glycosyltransferase involved in cell wall biosynthesis